MGKTFDNVIRTVFGEHGKETLKIFLIVYVILFFAFSLLDVVFIKNTVGFLIFTISLYFLTAFIYNEGFNKCYSFIIKKATEELEEELNIEKKELSLYLVDDDSFEAMRGNEGDSLYEDYKRGIMLAVKDRMKKTLNERRGL